MKKRYLIVVDGCDDLTAIDKELTKDEYLLIKEIAKEITETSTSVCMPRMEIEMIKNIGEEKND